MVYGPQLERSKNLYQIANVSKFIEDDMLKLEVFTMYSSLFMRVSKQPHVHRHVQTAVNVCRTICANVQKISVASSVSTTLMCAPRKSFHLTERTSVPVTMICLNANLHVRMVLRLQASPHLHTFVNMKKESLRQHSFHNAISVSRLHADSDFRCIVKLSFY